MGTATEHPTFPSQIDDCHLAWPAVAGWMLADDRRVIVRHDDIPECPLDSWDTGCTFHWADRAPHWDKTGIGHSDVDILDDLPRDAILFSVTEERDGNHYRVEDVADASRVDGYIIPPDDATNPREYVATVLDTITLWATGETYWWREEHRVTWTNDDGDTRHTWEPDDSCSGYYGVDAVIAGIKYGVEGAEGVKA
jgi:hypothetical protein